ncbi:MAG: AAA family ATPase [Pseudomonadota bacterium]
MLIQFRVTNFRSLRDEQVLSMVASRDKTLRDTHTLATGINAAPALLRSAAIYGPNAGGKSNLIKALQYMRGVVVESATAIQPGQIFSVQPFRLDAESSGKPTEFEATFVVDGIRHQYGFAMTAERIVSEHLLVYRAFKPQHWFKRHFDEESGRDRYDFGPGLKGQKAVWESATRPNALFLSMAVQLNSEQLKPVFDWFAGRLVIFNEHTPLNPDITIQMLRDAAGKQSICNFLGTADISIADIDVVTRKVPKKAVHFDLIADTAEVRAEEVEQSELRFHHATANGKAVFGLGEESSGTRNLLFLAGPVLDIVHQGLTLVIDELDTSLHTLLVRRLVQLFHNPDLNRNGAQLIFTTHDTALLDAPGLFRRDQVWFVEKERDQASRLYGLSDFSPRKNEALERGYLMGRYGGLPLLSDLEIRR